MVEKIKIKTKALAVKQRPKELENDSDFLKLYDFFIFQMEASKIIKISKFLSRVDSPLGVQRQHNQSRDKEIGEFIASDHPFFPNSIILNIPIEYNSKFYIDDSILEFELEGESAYVIDGQHRLKAFNAKYSKGVDLPLVVIAYFNLELPTIAEIFTRINYFQKPVNKSIVYDLLEFNKDPLFNQYKEAHQIVDHLNNLLSSPLYGMIKMLGIGTGSISQATLIEGLTSKYKIIELLNQNGFKTKQKIDLINNYFISISHKLQPYWGNKDSILTKSLGFYVLLNILKYILERHKQNYSLIPFDEYAEAIANSGIDFNDKSIGGFKGVNVISSKIFEIFQHKGIHINESIK